MFVHQSVPSRRVSLIPPTLPDLAMDSEIIGAIRAGARIVVNIWGGKDSSAAMFAVNRCLDLLGRWCMRLIVLIEARAEPRLRTVKGL